MLEKQRLSGPMGRLVLCWRTIVATYHHVNLLTHHLIDVLLKLLIVFYFLFCGIVLTLRYAILPNVNYYKSNIEHIASKAVNHPVTIGDIVASWHGLQPRLVLTDVAIHNWQKQPALTLPQVAATVSWRSFLIGSLRLASLEINRPDLRIERDQQGNVFVAGILVGDQENGGAGPEWLLTQHQIVIRHGQVRWTDHLRKAPELVLSDVNLLLRNRWRHHKFALQVTPPASFAAPLNVRVDFVHPAFAQKKADVRRWKGTLYTDLGNTDLTVWKAYIDYPVTVYRGKGALRAWLDFDQAKIRDLTADLQLSNVSTRLRHDLQPLELTSVSGRISVHEDMAWVLDKSKFMHGANGRAISFTDFSLKTDDGLMLPRTSINAWYVPAKHQQQEKYAVQVKQLDLQTVASFAQRLPLTLAQIQMLSDFAPGGQLRDFSVQWQGTYPAITAYSAKGQFSGLTVHAQPPRAAQLQTATQSALAAIPGVPGVTNLSGAVDFNQDGGTLSLMSEKMALHLPGYLTVPVLPFEKLDMLARWQVHEKNALLQIDSMHFSQEGVRGSLSGSYLMPLKPGLSALGAVDLIGNINEFDVKKISAYLPVNMPEHLRHWLTEAIKTGTAHDVAIRLKGALTDFPFSTSSTKTRGEFTVKGMIRDGKLEYVPGHFGQNGQQPLWPLLEKIDGTIAVERDRLWIKASSAETASVKLTNVTATIPDLSAHDSMLLIEGSAAGSLQNFVQFTQNSPVQHWIDGFTDASETKGNAKLQLSLHIPLAHAVDSKVKGTLQFLNNEVMLQPAIPLITHASGKLEFDERGFSLVGMKGIFLGGTTQVNGGTQADGRIQVKIDGSAEINSVHLHYPTPAMQRLLAHAGGSSRYNAVITIREHHPEIVVESALQGIHLELPEPLRKPAAEAMPLKFEWRGITSGNALTMQDELRLSLGSTITARYQRQKVIDNNSANWKVLRGGIGIDAPAPEPDSGLAINLHAKSLNLDAWNRLSSTLSDIGNNNVNPTTQLFEIKQYLEPNVLAVRVTQLTLLEKTLDNVVVGATHQKGMWQANIDSAQASGYVTWDEPSSGHGLGKVTARLSSLMIPHNTASDVGAVLEGKSASTRIPELDIVAEDFQLLGKKLGRLELAANNVRVNTGSQWRIANLSLRNSDAELKADGQWTVHNGENTTNLSYTLDITDAGKLLERFGFSHVLHSTKGRMNGEVSWKGLPFSIDIPSLSGQVHLDMAAGQFLKVDPGAAKLLGVLSLQSLPRRLTLDFRDVFSEGFAFDSLVGTATIAQGKARTDNFKMRGVSATVLMDGIADIAKETQNLHVVVLPEINAGAASVVALVINPVIGISTFLAQLFLRDPLMRAFTFEYTVTGAWKDPVVKKWNHKKEDSMQSTLDGLSTR